MSESFDAKQFLATVNGGKTISAYRTDQNVFAQGDVAGLRIFYIEAGNVKIVVTSEQGKEAVDAVLGKEDFFGEGCLIGQPLRLATATALTASRVSRN